MTLVAFTVLQNITLGLYFPNWRGARAVTNIVIFVDDSDVNLKIT